MPVTLPPWAARVRNRCGTIASKAKIPPSPSWSARMTNTRYLTVTTKIERPEHERQNAEQIRGHLGVLAPGGMQAFFQVYRADWCQYRRTPRPAHRKPVRPGSWRVRA